MQMTIIETWSEAERNQVQQVVFMDNIQALRIAFQMFPFPSN